MMTVCDRMMMMLAVVVAVGVMTASTPVRAQAAECDWGAYVCSTPEFSTLCSLLEYSNFPASPYGDAADSRPFTLLAPNNDAIAAFVESADLTLDGTDANKALVYSLLEYHMIENNAYIDGEWQFGMLLNTFLDGSDDTQETVFILLDDGDAVFVGYDSIADDIDNGIDNDTACISNGDGTSGPVVTIHEISAVLIPEPLAPADDEAPVEPAPPTGPATVVEAALEGCECLWWWWW